MEDSSSRVQQRAPGQVQLCGDRSLPTLLKPTRHTVQDPTRVTEKTELSSEGLGAVVASRGLEILPWGVWA